MNLFHLYSIYQIYLINSNSIHLQLPRDPLTTIHVSIQFRLNHHHFLSNSVHLQLQLYILNQEHSFTRHSLHLLIHQIHFALFGCPTSTLFEIQPFQQQRHSLCAPSWPKFEERIYIEDLDAKDAFLWEKEREKESEYCEISVTMGVEDRRSTPTTPGSTTGTTFHDSMVTVRLSEPLALQIITTTTDERERHSLGDLRAAPLAGPEDALKSPTIKMVDPNGNELDDVQSVRRGSGSSSGSSSGSCSGQAEPEGSVDWEELARTEEQQPRDQESDDVSSQRCIASPPRLIMKNSPQPCCSLVWSRRIIFSPLIPKPASRNRRMKEKGASLHGLYRFSSSRNLSMPQRPRLFDTRSSPRRP